MANKQPLTKLITTKKEFSYQKGLVSLNFTLKTDIKSELEDFRSCLDLAIQDIDNVLNEKRN
jgi:hypothetical protein